MSKPSFLFTYYNPFEKGHPGLFQSYINYRRNIDLAEYSAEIIGKTIEKASKEQIKELQKGFKMIDERLSRIHYEQISTNLLLKDIKELLKVPDSEKQRAFYIQRGLTFLAKTSLDQSVINDAICEFELAKEIMPNDWFVNYNLGICYLHFVDVLDIEKAKTNFEIAIKYARIEDKFSLLESVKCSNIAVSEYDEKRRLEIESERPFKDEISTVEAMRSSQPKYANYKKNWVYTESNESWDLFTTPIFHLLDSCVNLSMIYYALGEYESALKIINQSNKFYEECKDGIVYINKTYQEKIRFYKAKYSARIGQIDVASMELKFIKQQQFLFLALQDEDFKLLPDLQNTINDLINKISDTEKSDDLNDRLYSLCKLCEYYIEGRREKIKDLDVSFDLIQNGKKIVPTAMIFSIDDLRLIGDDSEDFCQPAKFIYDLYKNNPSFISFCERSEKFNEIFSWYVYWVGKSKTEVEHVHSKNPEIKEKMSLFFEIISLLPKEINEELICQKYVEYGGLENCKSETIKQFSEIANQTKQTSKNDKRCFIATATLNNENHPVVVDLREFRDQWLLRRKWGYTFVDWYYKTSPFYANIIRKSSTLRLISYMLIVAPIHRIIRLTKRFHNQ